MPALSISLNFFMRKLSVFVFSALAFSFLLMGNSLAANPCTIGSSGGTFDAGTYNCNGANIGGPQASIILPAGQSVTLTNVGSFQAQTITGNGGTNQNGASISITAANVSIDSISVNGGSGSNMDAIRCIPAGSGGSGGSVTITTSGDLKINSISSSGGNGGYGVVAYYCRDPGYRNGGSGGSITLSGSSVQSQSNGAVGITAIGGVGGNGGYGYTQTAGGPGGNGGSVSVNGLSGPGKASVNLAGGRGGWGYNFLGNNNYQEGYAPSGQNGQLSLRGSPAVLGSFTGNSINIVSQTDFLYTSGISSGSISISARNMTLGSLSADSIGLSASDNINTGNIAAKSIGLSGNKITSGSITGSAVSCQYETPESICYGGSIAISAKELIASSLGIGGNTGGSLDLSGVDNVRVGSISVVNGYCTRMNYYRGWSQCVEYGGSPTTVRLRTGLCIGPPSCNGAISGRSAVSNVYNPPSSYAAPQQKSFDFFGSAKTKSGLPLTNGSVVITITNSTSTAWGPFTFNNIISGGTFKITVGAPPNLFISVPGSDYTLRARISDKVPFSCSSPAVCEEFQVAFKG
jgi:hypothetical protein